MTSLEQIEDQRIIAVIRAADQTSGGQLAEALIDAGVRILEFTTTLPGAFELITHYSQRSDLLVGLGTAMSESDVNLGVKAGARFIVSPHTSAEVVTTTKKAGLLSIPGVGTATEVAQAITLGADVLKLFPGGTYGPGHLRSLRDPFPHRTWMVTGGVTPTSLSDWIAAGASAFGLGGPLTAGGVGDVARRMAEFRASLAAL
jgi:2-dehydro-3-deoxyphosphogluconate aldolase / (4S)-4-hydroxy-2-oxoglutarate aldolase